MLPASAVIQRALKLLFALAVFMLTCTTNVAHAGVGHVAYATRNHAYLDVGSEDGLRVGDELTLQKTGASTTRSCKVEAVSEHHARCAGESLPKRARFSFKRGPITTPPVSRTVHFAPLSHSHAQQIQTTLAAAPFPLVPNDSLPARLFGHGSLSLNHDVWAWLGVQPRTVQGERIELSARIAPFSSVPDLAIGLRMSALFWTQQESIRLRFRGGQAAQLYVWQSDVSMRGASNHLVFGVGRTLTWYTPGLAALDGAQVGYRTDDAKGEIGVFGGVIPNPSTLELNTEHITAGLYARAQGHAGDVWVVSNTARLAYMQEPNALSRVELEDRVEFTHGAAFQASLSPRLGYGISGDGFSLDALRFDISSQVIDTLNLYAGLRYANAHLDVSNGMIAPQQILRSTLFSTIAANFQVNRDVSLGLMNAVARDNDNDYMHVSTGPQLTLPHLFGRYGDFSAMILVEQNNYPQATAPAFGSTVTVDGSGGWQNGASVFLSSALTPTENVRVWARLNWMADVFQADSLLQQMGYYVRAETSLLEWLDVGAFVRLNHGVVSKYVALSQPVNILASIQLTGHL